MNAVAVLAGMVAMSACKEDLPPGGAGEAVEAAAPADLTTPRAKILSPPSPLRPRPGIYRIESHLDNRHQCEPGGDSLLVTGRDQFVSLVVSKEQPHVVLKVRSCDSPSDCRAPSGEGDDRQAPDFELTLSVQPDGKLGRQAAHAGFLDGGGCEGGAWVASAEIREDRIEIQRRHTRVEHYPRGRDGACWTDDAQAAADQLGCSRLEQLTAVFVEAL